MKRKDFNLKIYEDLKRQNFFGQFFDKKTANRVDETLYDCINDYPEQRFGQIFTNYIYPDYRSRTEPAMNMIIDVLFYGVEMDPFFEESEDTYHRLVRES